VTSPTRGSSSRTRAVNTFAVRPIPEQICHPVRCDRPELTDEANRCRGPANDFLGRQSRLPQLADAGVSSTLAQFLAARFQDQRGVAKRRPSVTPEHLPEAKLTSRG